MTHDTIHSGTDPFSVRRVL